MLRKLIVGISLGGLMTLAAASGVFAASNPNGTGQPNQECGSAVASESPTGFGTAGFANAENVYVGSGVSASQANSDNAVSQYDVACYQVSQSH